MKKLLIIVALGILLQNYTFPQGCLPEGITFTTQAQIDSFPINYPGCTEIEGDVTIYDIYSDSITNLNGLSVLTSIGGNLSISWHTALTILTGLNNVATIGGSLILGNNMDWGNGALTSLTGLEGLTSIGGGISIWPNSSLTSLTGLDNLNTIGGDINIGWNDALTSLTGLENVTSIGSISIYFDSSLTSLIGLDNVTFTGGTLYIQANDILTSLAGLENLNSIGGNLVIEGNYSLNSLSGLNNVTSIAGSIVVDGNQSLTSLGGLDNIAAGSIAGLNVSFNNSLSSCNVQSICDYLAAPNGVVEIFGNAAGCSGPPEVAGNCGITLSCLPYGDYYFLSQADIDNFTNNFPGCTALEGNVSIQGNDISNLLGLGMITSIGGNLIIGGIWGGGGSSLTSLEGLDSLTSIGGYLSIEYNTILGNLTGLENVTSIGGNLYIGYNGYLNIEYNNELTSLAGLDNIDAASINGLYISYNTSLSTCEVQSVCNYLAAPGGIISIGSNAPGCNSQEEVEAACQVGFESIPEKGICAIYPNPSNGWFTVEFYLQQPSMVNLVVQNNLGQVVAKLAAGILTSGTHQVFWNAMNLPAGIYYGRLQAGDQIYTNKIIKIQ